MAVTLQTYLAGAAEPGLAGLLEILVGGCAEIGALVRRGAVGEIMGALESENVQGEV